MEQVIMILENKKLKYNTARERILDAILSGGLAENLMLPSEQELGRRLGIGRNTVRTALRELEQDGIIIKQNGRPSQVNPEALREKKTPLRRIAWVDTSPINHTNPIYFEIFRSITESAANRNVQLDYISLSIPAMAANFFRKQLEYHGLILGEFTSQYKKFLAEITHKNTVCVDCPRPGIAHCVKTDCYLGGQLAARALIESGYRRLAIVNFSRSAKGYLPFEERFQGFCDFLKTSDILLPPERILNVSTAAELNKFNDFLKEHFAELRQADGLFVMSDSYAVAALYALENSGLQIPDDLSLIGFDGLTLSRFVSPVLTTIRQPVREIGCKALEIVLNPAESASYPEIIQIPPSLENGDTVLKKEKVLCSK